MNISEKLTAGFPAFMASDSRKDNEEKDQQVLVLCWFFTSVFFTSCSTVNRMEEDGELVEAICPEATVRGRIEMERARMAIFMGLVFCNIVALFFILEIRSGIGSFH